MNSQSQDVLVEPLPVSEIALADAESLPRQRLLSPRAARAIVSAGRFVAIWLPIFAFSSARSTTVASIFEAAALGSIWHFSLRHAFAQAHATTWSLGSSVAAGVGTLVGLAPIAALDAWLPALHLSVPTLFEAAFAVFLFTVAWEATVRASGASRKRVLIVGADGGGVELVEELALMRGCPFELVGVVDDERDSDRIAGTPLHGRIDQLAEIVGEHQPDLVVLANDRCRGDAFNGLLDIAHLGFAVVGLPEFYEYAFGRLPVRNLTARWFMSILHLYQRPYTRLAKRSFDLVVASVGLLLTAPLYPLLALIVRRTPGPALYRQTRLGEAGRHFTIYKFRTMRVDAEQSGAVWAAEHDPRITRAGRVMRKTRLDELPQLWNVLRGDMSIVGPRPERPEFAEKLQAEVPFWSRRHLVKPGVTGWAQVRRGYTADAESTSEKLSYDLWYLRHRSLVVDLAICVKTFSTLLSGSGAR